MKTEQSTTTQTPSKTNEDAPECTMQSRSYFRYVIDDGVVIMESEMPEGIPAYLASKE